MRYQLWQDLKSWEFDDWFFAGAAVLVVAMTAAGCLVALWLER